MGYEDPGGRWGGDEEKGGGKELRALWTRSDHPVALCLAHLGYVMHTEEKSMGRI